ncbi:MAG: acyl-ACP desaturase [Mycobacterium sp.]|jgi:acyl-[acyl-carrier-protein] desaturase|nr:acyl-ACP desaturase [Mycobacterium sp.]
MGQKPAANELTAELEPVVADNLAVFLEHADEWYAHDYVPFDQGENFAFLGGRDWDPSQVTLPGDVVDALEVLLVTKDNLAGYHRELVEHFILEGKWGRWLGRWTAEENLHAIAIRDYLVVTRNFDPTANEEVRVAHVMRGYRADQYTQIETLVFMAFYERAHAVFLRNLEARLNDSKVDEPALKNLISRMARDEERHEQFFAKLVAYCVKHHNDQTIGAISRRAFDFDVVGGDILEYRENKLRTVAEAGIFDQEMARRVVSDRINDWGVADSPMLVKYVLG